MLLHGFQELNHYPVTVPRRPKLRPSRGALDRRFQELLKT